MRAVTEIFKTIVWFPWAILELLSRDLGPDARNLLAIGVSMTTGLFIVICVMIKLILVDGMALASFPWLFAVEIWLMGYLAFGAFTRYLGRNLSVLR